MSKVQNLTQETVKENSIHVSNDEILLEKVLIPYKANCKYLKSAELIKEGDPQNRGRIIGRCELSIPESCYIDDTGHFNSVEFNIAYNQMSYYLIAKSIKERLMTSFNSWTINDYWAKQLSNMYIVNFESSFRRPINSSKFWGEIEFNKICVVLNVEALQKMILALYSIASFVSASIMLTPEALPLASS